MSGIPILSEGMSNQPSKREMPTMAKHNQTWRSRVCQCSDPGCPAHKAQSWCANIVSLTAYRIDMEDRTGTPMCEKCSDDAMDSGVFTTEAK